VRGVSKRKSKVEKSGSLLSPKSCMLCSLVASTIRGRQTSFGDGALKRKNRLVGATKLKSKMDGMEGWSWGLNVGERGERLALPAACLGCTPGLLASQQSLQQDYCGAPNKPLVARQSYYLPQSLFSAAVSPIIQAQTIYGRGQREAAQ
jgi:hypothetical protein